MNYKEPLQPSCMYHLFNRGNNKENIFKEPDNYSYFLTLCKKYITPVADIHCYCLLPNHFHLLIHTKNNTTSKLITQAFSNCFNAYTKSINKAYKRTGSYFRNVLAENILMMKVITHRLSFTFIATRKNINYVLILRNTLIHLTKVY